MTTKTTDWVKLPDDLQHLLNEYVDIVSGAFGLTCRRLLVFRKQNTYMELSRPYSIRYFDDEVFRGRVISSMDNIGRQLSLNLSGCSNAVDVSVLGNVHTLTMCNCNKVLDVAMLGTVNTMDLSGCVV